MFDKFKVQAFLDFRGFEFLDFRFNTVYNSILFSSPLVLLSNLDFRGFRFPRFFHVSPDINSVNRGMPVSFSKESATMEVSYHQYKQKILKVSK